ncbi:MAG TPA: FxsA family protein [Aeromonadales bacterium]|nr:FxsA family protein [Aeromonadales bacterium]
MIWLLVILLFPLLEISVFIDMGRALGAGPVILLTIGTAIWGMAMVRIQGMDTYKRMQQSMARGETPAFEMIEGTLLLIAGFFLLLPGFITDAMGLVLLIPPVRKWLALKSFQSPSGFQSRFIVMGQTRKEDSSNSENTKKGRTIDQDDDHS